LIEHRALISVWNKDGIEEFAKGLSQRGWQLLSSSGTARRLEKAGVPVKEVADLTGYPHILGGRVKTLHPAVIGGILARRHFEEDLNDVERYGIPLIDIVTCNLYPFEEKARQGANLDELLEHIDIGGVTLLRAAAKNYHYVVVVTDPSDYKLVLDEIDSEGNVTLPTRERLALKAFSYTARYDAVIYAGLCEALGEKMGLPQALPLAMDKALDLRYGENPHQAAALYLPPLSNLPWEVLSGKPLSYNNILDADCALRGCALLSDQPGCVIVKHTSPCGMACGEDLKEAYAKALECDPISAFGGIVGLNRQVTTDLAETLSERFFEIAIAPDFEPASLSLLKEKRPNMRLLRWNGGRAYDLQLVGTWGGILAQEDTPPPLPRPEAGEWVGKPRNDLWPDLILAWKAAYLGKSNAIAVVKDGGTVGIGCGFPSRVDAVRWALERAGEKVRGAVLASDAFFPFADSVELASQAGIAAIIQPGGSVRDGEVKEAALRLGVSMFLSGWRTFRH